ncbi:endonuclease/exonuclease/phosphatase family protein [Vibrio sp. Isolate25]|uniref:endonuclease/exonuclease/phosphatase family protein n=1 Tax=Vibrio sp. Isolate25 TaxID=2908535 RepID=UPI001EFE037B|nr:endonuclease/exonuclease/phosphatase family protein [Vibrio sp. Isolate25]MCG9596644.1 endonuclease/exonuclease/phosphatase family protein [Vibrio sp. Isolate25]
MKKKLVLLSPLIVLAMVVFGFQIVFSLPDTPQLSTISSQGNALSLQCFNSTHTDYIDKDRQLKVLVWNIYKQNRSHWRQELTQYTQDKQLVLLQEASMSPELKGWIQESGWYGNQVDAFKAFKYSAGVLNLSAHTPLKACAYTELEPWLRLPKSAIYATYPLSNGQLLAVVNIHAVNFTYGTKEYQNQLGTLVTELTQHTGPIVIGGDFNSWSEQRLKVMKQVLDALEMEEASYEPDNRTQFMTGLPLDHVFYRGLTLIKAEAPESDASDHNPIEVTFQLTDGDI